MTSLAHVSLRPNPYQDQPVEIVERKGIGHPDTICDAVADEFGRALCAYYQENFGLVLHHNVDKALLWGGTAEPAFGGGRLIAPIEIFVAGRASCDYKGIEVPIDELLESSCHNWLTSHFHALDPSRDVKLHSLIRPGSSDLVELYSRQHKSGVALANDTSCGVGYAPLSELERIVLHIEQTLNSAAVKHQHPEIGEDIKVMAIRQDRDIAITVACAFVDRYLTDADDYIEKKARVAELARQSASKVSDSTISIIVNAADDIDSKSLYMTVTGTSAESGDDGEVGRGNRANGLIAPYRPMNMEAAAGKNPVTHVGKLYNIVAQKIALGLVEELDQVTEACCYLVSQIGAPVKEPQIVDIQLKSTERHVSAALRASVDRIVREKLEDIDQIANDTIRGSVRVY